MFCVCDSSFSLRCVSNILFMLFQLNEYSRLWKSLALNPSPGESELKKNYVIVAATICVALKV